MGPASKTANHSVRLVVGRMVVSGWLARCVASARGLVAALRHCGHAIYSMLCKAVRILSHCTVFPLFDSLYYQRLAKVRIAKSLHAQYTHTHIGLDNDTRSQLNRVEAMLHALCARHGIEPSTLPGYEQPRSVSPSIQSISSITSPGERLDPSDVPSEPDRNVCEYICVN